MITITLTEEQLSALLDEADFGIDEHDYLITQGDYDEEDIGPLEQKLEQARTAIVLAIEQRDAQR